MLTGAILAGGNSRRMDGVNKALLPFGNERILERQIRSMKELCDEVILVTNEPRLFLPIVGSSIRIITDFMKGQGPLGGMHAAFTLSRHSDIWVVGGDMPFISSEAAERMWQIKQQQRCMAVVPLLEGETHPLHAVYDKRCASYAAQQLEAGNNKVKDLLGGVTHCLLEQEGFGSLRSDPSFVFNVNTPQDYKEALAYMGRTTI
jgi:molybdopterin-guanine dinucleotide biosynthesis protein A